MFERKKPPKTLNNRDIVSMNHGCRYSTIPIGSQLDGCSFLSCVSRSQPLGAQATCTAASPSGFASSGMRYRPGVAWWWDRGLGGGPISS